MKPDNLFKQGGLLITDQFADAGHQHICCSHGLAVGVLLHVEALDLFRVVGDEDGLLNTTSVR